MSDMDRGRRRRRRGRGKFDGSRSEFYREYEEEQPPMPSRPIILAKPDRSTSTQPDLSRSPPEVTTATTTTQPATFTLKTRDDPGVTNVPNIPSMLAGDSIPPQVYVGQKPETANLKAESTNRFGATPEMVQPVKLVDENFIWRDMGVEALLDHADFFVIGIIGPQGCGKSTVMSLLAGSENNRKEYKFKAQSFSVLEQCGHQTVGIDMYVTNERMILLDTQPVLSASVLDQLIQSEKKLPADYVSTENYAEMQSLQMTSFLLTVCNVVIVCMDWFVDLSLLDLLQTAEMLKPASPTGGSSSSESGDGAATEQYFPHVVFLLNKANRSDFESQPTMTSCLSAVMQKSNLRLYNAVCDHHADSLNLYLLPTEQPRKKQENGDGVLPAYEGHAPFSSLMTNLRNQLQSLPRHPLTHAMLSEKNWFHYAARTWDVVKKSSLFAEYNRMLTS